MGFFTNLFRSGRQSEGARAGETGRTTVAGDSDAKWTDKALHCPKCRAKLHDKTPQFGAVRCSQCGVMFTVRDYRAS